MVPIESNLDRQCESSTWISKFYDPTDSEHNFVQNPFELEPT